MHHHGKPKRIAAVVSSLVIRYLKDECPQFYSVKSNPPAADGLSASDCERVIIALLVEDVFDTNIVWNAYE